MNREIFEGNWNELKGKMKQAWGWMTDDDIKQIEGNHQEIYGKLQKHYGYGRDEAERAVDKFRNQFRQH
jgi:uncharacterized protein YjbJ (UPF0337 family)